MYENFTIIVQNCQDQDIGIELEGECATCRSAQLQASDQRRVLEVISQGKAETSLSFEASSEQKVDQESNNPLDLSRKGEKVITETSTAIDIFNDSPLDLSLKNNNCHCVSRSRQVSEENDKAKNICELPIDLTLRDTCYRQVAVGEKEDSSCENSVIRSELSLTTEGEEYSKSSILSVNEITNVLEDDVISLDTSYGEIDNDLLAENILVNNAKQSQVEESKSASDNSQIKPGPAYSTSKNNRDASGLETFQKDYTIISDSICKYATDLQNTDLQAESGLDLTKGTNRILNKIFKVEKYKVIIIHIGSNDLLVCNFDTRYFLVKLPELLRAIRSLNPDGLVIFSSILPMPKFGKNIDILRITVNKIYERFALKHYKTFFIPSWRKFLHNDRTSPKIELFARDKWHLSKRGTVVLKEYFYGSIRRLINNL